jgi:superfamily I DNA/RNA helicase
VERSRRGPIFVRGGPGSGKSLLGLYRALHALDRAPTFDRPTPRVLYATFTRALADDTREKVVLLRGAVPDGLEISTVDRLVERFAPKERTTIYDEPAIAAAWHDACIAADPGRRFDEKFARSEIEDVIIARGLHSVDAYLGVSRTGRTRRLAQGDRRAIWDIYANWEALLAARASRTLGLARLAALDAASSLADDERYDLVVVDEVQDLTTTALGFAIALARGTNSGRDVTLIGDGGQSIYRAGFKWADVGIRLGGGNVVTLATCERSSPEIMRFAAALSGRQPEEHDEDASVPRSGNERSAQRPRVRRYFADREDQRAWLIGDIRSRLTEVAPRRIAVIARTKAELDRVREALTTAKIPCIDYGDPAFHRRDAVRCITAHSAKGLEFGDVYIVGADDGSFPLSYPNATDDARAESIGIDARLLYVAVTRARERITILCGPRPSPFLAPALGFAEVLDM